jgi:very-short-patch-repair endonuclease
VLRFWNLDFIENREGVLERIRLVLEEGPSSRSHYPSPASAPD